MTDKTDKKGNTGNRNTGDWNTGDRNTGDWNTGDWNTGNRNTGYRNTGNCNTGYCNTGDRNTGYRNTGNCNTGNRNTGDCNTGDWNTGNRNTGDCNTGDWNTGDRNTGYRNTGNCNTGNRNTGDWNTGDCNTGYFNTITPKVTLFNKVSDLDFDNQVIIEVRNIIHNNITPICTWVCADDMTNEEKEEYPTYKTTGGYLKTRDYRYCWKKGWDKMTEEDRQKIKDLPNFDSNIFREITGIDIDKSSKKKVTLELTDEQLNKINLILKEDA